MHANPDLRVVLKWMINRSGSVITDVITLRIEVAMTDRPPLDTQVDKIVRLFERDVIYASEAAHKIIDDIEYDIRKFGLDRQIEWLIDFIPTLPEPIKLEMKSYVETSDEKMFVRNTHVSGPFPPPENVTPAPMAIRSRVDYSGETPKITVTRSDGTSYEIDALDPWPKMIFALRLHFSQTQENA